MGGHLERGKTKIMENFEPKAILLRACPYCGNRVFEIDGIMEQEFYTIHCLCGVTGGKHDTLTDAYEHWNKRV
jgi:hypothetical protein